MGGADYSWRDYAIEFWIGAEMEEEAYIQGRCAEVVEELALIGGGEDARCFYFNSDTIFDEDIQLISANNFAFE